MADGARQSILARVRQAQIRGHIPASPEGLPARLEYPVLDMPARRERLLKEFALLGVETHVEADEAAVRGRVKGLIAGKSVLSWDAERLPYGVGACLQGERACFGHDSKETQAGAEIGLTGCEAALAETGSLAVISGPGKPRAASLLPYVHVAVLRGADILLGMGECFDRLQAAGDLPYLVFITGPSRTADIELSLTLGVHGPGKVIVVIGP